MGERKEERRFEWLVERKEGKTKWEWGEKKMAMKEKKKCNEGNVRRQLGGEKKERNERKEKVGKNERGDRN